MLSLLRNNLGISTQHESTPRPGTSLQTDGALLHLNHFVHGDSNLAISRQSRSAESLAHMNPCRDALRLRSPLECLSRLATNETTFIKTIQSNPALHIAAAATIAEASQVSHIGLDSEEDAHGPGRRPRTAVTRAITRSYRACLAAQSGCPGREPGHSFAPVAAADKQQAEFSSTA